MWRHDLKLFACRGGYNRAPWHGRELKERHRMRIWVDADACPGVIKEILFRAAARAAVSLTLVANKPLRVPRSPHIRTVQVAGGFDVADRWIAGEITTDNHKNTTNIPLAAAVIEKGAQALNPRGELYTAGAGRGRGGGRGGRGRL